MFLSIYFEKINIEEVMKYFNKKVLAIPKLQRNFVWNPIRLRDLADSIYKGYPIGTFIIWDTDKRKQHYLKHHTKFLPPYDEQKNDKINYVIDGQQRLITLYSFLMSGGKELENERGVQFNSYDICFSHEEDENDLNFFYSRPKKKESERYKYRICNILSEDFESEFGHLKNSKPRLYRKLGDCRKRFLSYPLYFAHISQDVKPKNLREIFIRVNTKGLTLSAADRRYAFASDVDLRDYVEKLQSKMGIFQTLDPTPIHETIYMINNINQERFNSAGIDNVFKKINDDLSERKQFMKSWTRISKSIESAETFLKRQGVISLKYLPSTTMVAVLSTFYYYNQRRKVSPYQEKQLKKWFWFSAVSGRYSGEGWHKYPAKDCKVMNRLAEGKRPKFEDVRLVSSYKLNDSLYYSSKSSLTRAFYCLLALQKPLDFSDGNPLDLRKPTYTQREESHHIFSEDLLNDLNIARNKLNSILNICYLPKYKNASFNKDPPYKYLNSDKVRKNRLNIILKSHLIPSFIQNKPKIIRNQFDQFLKERKKLIIKSLESEAEIKLFEDDIR